MRLCLMVVLATALLSPLPAAAQHWMTRERCTVTDIRIDPAVLPPARLTALRAEAATVPNGVGTHWRVIAASGATSHLWGTWHSNDPVMLDLPEQVEDTVRAARVAAFEFDPVFPTRRAVENAASPRDFWRARGGGLAALNLSADIERWINARFVSIGWGDRAADFMTPGALAETLLNDPCNDFSAGAYPIQDSYLQTLAAIEGARIIGLEPTDSFRDKMNRTRNFPLARDTIMLFALSLSPDGTAAERATGFALYMNGEHAAARAWERAILAERFGPTEAAAIQDRVDAYLLEERNAGFVQRLLPELDGGDVFIGVVAWHLQGPRGMVARLQEAGYRVERIPLNRERPDQP